MITRTRTALCRCLIAAVVATIAVGGCGGGKSATPPSTTSATTTTSIATAPPKVFDGSVDVRGGRHLKARCYGAGSPTVLLEAGDTSSNLDDWPMSFVSLVAANTTTCLYSRAGGKGSSPVDGLLTRAQIVDDAYTLLDSLHRDHGVNGPFVFVGQSFGGSVGLAEALEHPETTKGLVILDTGFPVDFMPICVASGHPASACQAEYKDDEEAKSIEKDIVVKVRPLPGIPIAVVSALALTDCRLEPGATTVTESFSGTDLTAPNCDALGVAVADKNRAEWGQLGPQVTDIRINTDHDHLVRDASAQIAAIVLQIVTSGR